MLHPYVGHIQRLIVNPGYLRPWDITVNDMQTVTLSLHTTLQATYLRRWDVTVNRVWRWAAACRHATGGSMDGRQAREPMNCLQRRAMPWWSASPSRLHAETSSLLAPHRSEPQRHEGEVSSAPSLHRYSAKILCLFEF